MFAGFPDASSQRGEHRSNVEAATPLRLLVVFVFFGFGFVRVLGHARALFVEEGQKTANVGR